MLIPHVPRYGTLNSSQQISASDAGTDDLFGGSVAVSRDGSTLVVGAYGEDGAGDTRGAAYVYRKAGGVWTQQIKLTASDAANFDYFGKSVACSSNGNTVVVGAHNEDGAGTDRGKVYVYSGSSHITGQRSER